MTAWLARSGPHILAGSLCAGIAAANGVRTGWMAAAVVAVAAAFAGAAVGGQLRLTCLAIALATAGLWWGSVRLDALDHTVLGGRIGAVGRIRAAVTAPPRRTRFGVRAMVQVRRFDRLQLRESALLELPVGRSPPQGTVLETIVKIRAPRPRQDGFDEGVYLRRRGMHVVLEGGAWRAVGRRGGLAGIADRLHARLERSLAPGVDGERRALIAGIVLGEDAGLSEELRDRFRASGLYHLLAVSGQNVGLVVGGVLMLAWLVGIPRRAAEIAALAAIGAYVAAVGWQPSVVRAGVAGALASLAWLVARPRDRWYFLLAGAALLLAWNPHSVLDPGFQLSFAAVAAIFVAVPVLGRRLEGYPVPRKVGDIVAVSAACGLATAPILWVHFGGVPVFSVVSNLLAAPAVAPLLAAAFACAALEPVMPELAATVAWANGWLAAYIALCARLVGGLPLAQTSSPFVLLGLAVVALLIAVVPRLTPPRGPRILVLGLLAGSAAVAVVGVARLGATSSAPPTPPHGFRLTALDVGQGDAILLQTRGGAVLVDQGPPEAHVDRQLLRLGVRRLALLVLTHPQRDHVGGAADVLRRLDVDAVLDPGVPADSPEQRAAMAVAEARDTRVVRARAGQVFRLGKLRLRLLWPARLPLVGDDPNNWAVVMLASYGALDALLTADAESNVTLPLRPPRAEVLKVAHHGSADDGLERLLDAVRPELAVVSVGAGNDYGHPAPSTVHALDGEDGLAWYRTDRDGAVAIESDGREVWVRTGS